MDTHTLEIHIAHRVAVVWMAREKVAMPSTRRMIAELRATFERLGADPGVRRSCWPPAGRVLRRRRPRLDAPHGGLLARREPARTPATGRHAAHDLRVPEANHRPGARRRLRRRMDWWRPATWPSPPSRRLLPERDPAGLIRPPSALRDPRHWAPTAAARYMLTAEKFDSAERSAFGLVHDLAPATARRQGQRNARCADDDLGRRRERAKAPGARGRRPGRSTSSCSPTRPSAIRRHPRLGRRAARACAPILDKRKPRWVSDYEAEVAARRGRRRGNVRPCPAGCRPGPPDNPHHSNTPRPTPSTPRS